MKVIIGLLLKTKLKKRKTPNKNKKILNIKSKKIEPVQSVKEKKLRSGKRYSQKTSFIESTPKKKKESDVKIKKMIFIFMVGI